MSTRCQVNASVDPEMAAKLKAIEDTRGVKAGTMARLALRHFVPLYEAGVGRIDHLEFLAALAADLAAAPELQADLERFRLLWLRDPAAARAALKNARRAA